jgi:hypothetical protein
MKTFLLSSAALTSIIASVQGCIGGPKEISIVIPKDPKSSNTTFYLQWYRPWGVQMGKFGPISCSINPGGDSSYVYGGLNITSGSDTIYAKPMVDFGTFVQWTNGTRQDEYDKNMKWHVSNFAASTKNATVTSLVLDVLVEGTL